MLKTMTRAGLVVMTLAFAGFQARADTFQWSYSILVTNAGPNNQNLVVDASGMMTTTNTAVNGALLITGITGSRTTNWWSGHFLNPPETDQIVGLVPPGVITPNPPDNLLYPNSSAVLDQSGFGYLLNCIYCGSVGSGMVQITNYNGEYLEIGPGGLGAGYSSFSLTPVAVPEPAPFALLALAAFGTVLCGWRSSGKSRTERA